MPEPEDDDTRCWGESGSHRIEDDLVCCPCPNCCEADPDKLVWLDDDETVRCEYCGHEYKP